MTDLVGHRRLDWTPQQALQRIDAFLQGVLQALPPAATLLITSDHGNLEDPGFKGHTYNPVPLIVRGPGAAHFAAVHDLTGVTPAILAYLTTLSPVAAAHPVAIAHPVAAAHPSSFPG